MSFAYLFDYLMIYYLGIYYLAISYLAISYLAIYLPIYLFVEKSRKFRHDKKTCRCHRHKKTLRKAVDIPIKYRYS